jgi:hypothetical protein
MMITAFFIKSRRCGRSVQIVLQEDAYVRSWRAFTQRKL